MTPFLMVRGNSHNVRASGYLFIYLFIKGDCNPDDKYLLYAELSEPWILIQVSSKSVEKYGSYGRLNICKWTLMEAAIL